MRLKEVSQADLWQVIRRRIIEETCSFLSEALRRPEMGVSIPMFVVGTGSFSREFSEEFWRRVLGE